MTGAEWVALIGLIIAGYKAMDLGYQRGERKKDVALQEKQLASEERVAAAERKGAKKSLKETRSREDEYMKMMMSMNEMVRGEERESRSFSAMQASKDRQAMMMMQMMSALMANKQEAPSGVVPPSSGMLSLLR